MNNGSSKEKIGSNKSNSKEFDTILKICLIIGIIIISGFIIYFVLKPEPGFVTFGILNENQEAENYPTQASVNETISFYMTVDNYLDKVFNFNIKIKKGDNTTVLSSTGSNGTLQYMINSSINHKEKWVSNKLNISFSQVGANQIIIAELWQNFVSKPEEFYNILWLRLNITS
ncbi:MAG: DUF1616 domain-containing protein [Candidatus Hermodarchaeota archaeon]